MTRAKLLATAMTLYFLSGFAHGGMLNDDDRDGIVQLLAKNKCAARKIDFRTTETGRILFWRMLEVPGDVFGYYFQLMKFDLTRKTREELIGFSELKSFMSRQELINVTELTSDRNMNYVVLNAVTSSDGQDPAAGLSSEIIIFDLKAHKVVTRIFGRKYHTNISMSDDSRYLAYYAHSDQYLVSADPARFPLYQVEVFDLKTSSSRVLIKANSGGSSGGDFVWREDSRTMVFFKRILEGGAHPLKLFAWHPESGKLDSYDLTKNNRENVNHLSILPNGKILINTPREILLFKDDISFDRIVYAGNGINSLMVGKDGIHFRESYNRGGYGEYKFLPLD